MCLADNWGKVSPGVETFNIFGCMRGNPKQQQLVS